MRRTGYSTPRAGSYSFQIDDYEFPYLKENKRGFSFCSERLFNQLKEGSRAVLGETF